MPIPNYNFQHVLNVKEYGAVGDGITDDIVAIQDALQDVATNFGGFATTTSDGLAVAVPFTYTIYFPPGKYGISQPIVMDSTHYGVDIIGDNAVLWPTANANFNGQFAFQHDYCYDFKMTNMHFAKFENAVKLYNPGVESGIIELNNCSFQENNLGLEINNQSAITIIDRSKFLACDIAVNIVLGDKVIIRNCWISSKQGMAGTHPSPIINTNSRLFMESTILVPESPDPGTGACIEPAWIKNYKSVTISSTRQGGENGGGFTLINNFAGIGDMLTGLSEPNSVTVRDCQCYGVFGEDYTTNYFQPAVVRFVGAIPNKTSIEDNVGMIQAKMMGFSKYLYNDDTTAIQNMIQASGAPGIANDFNVVVNVANNVGGFNAANSPSLIPQELWSFVRDTSCLWPYKPSINLPLLQQSIESTTGAQLFKFEYPEDLNAALLINYSGNPNSGGSSKYRGGFVGIIKANGAYNGSVADSLFMEPLFNHMGENIYPDDHLSVDIYWEATNSKFLDFSNTSNRNFVVRIFGSDGNWDQIKVAPIDSILN